MRNDNFSSVLNRYVEALGIKIAPDILRGELRKHPDYYSLAAYNDVLANYGISTGAYQVSFKDLSKISLPAITCLNDRNYAVITEVKHDYVILADDKRKLKKITNEEFEKLYRGVVQTKDNVDAIIDYSNTSYRQTQLTNLRPYITVLLCLLLIGLFLANSNFLASVSWSLLVLTLFKALGIFVSCLLLIQSMDANNPLLNRFCSPSEKVDCGAILSSDAAKLTSFLSWSEVGFFYFAGSFLALVFVPSSLSILALLNLFALPYTFYSIYYQYKVAKKWCTLCCAVQALLWVEFLSFLPFLSFDFPYLGFLTLVNILMLFLIPIAVWNLTKSFLLKLSEVDVVEDQLRTLKYNKQIFTSALKENLPIEAPDQRFSIVLGSNEPKHIITMVASPYCKPCAQAHTQIEEALNTMPSLQIRIVFAGNDLTRTDDTLAVRRHLMALKNENDSIKTKAALNDWYGGPKRSYKIWSEKYPVPFSAELDALLLEQKEWAIKHQITQTPTILINGYKMPLIYQLHELKYMLDS